MAEKAKKAEVEAVEVPTEETPQVEAPVVSEAQANPEKFLKDFNWHNYQEGIDEVDDKQLKEFEKFKLLLVVKWKKPNRDGNIFR